MRLHLADVISRSIQHHLDDVHTCLPGQIVTYDAKNQSAQVKPLIKKTYYNGQVVSLPVIVNVPVGMPSGGGATINMPIKSGDKVLILFSERSLERWLATGEDTEQGVPRRFDLTDAFAITGFNPLNYESKGNGEDFIIDYNNTTITIKSTGEIELKTDKNIDLKTTEGDITLSTNKNIEIKSSGGDVNLQTNGGIFSITDEGKFDISNGSDNLFSILNDTLEECRSITVNGYPIDNPSAFTALINRLNNLTT